MATQLFLQKLVSANEITADRFSLGTNTPKLDGSASGWTKPLGLKTSRDGGNEAASGSTVAGTTLGVEIAGTFPFQWVSPPIDQDVTISGTITFNLWMSESSMSANVGPQVVIERIDSTGAVVSTVVNSEKGTELPTTIAAQNWTAAPTSTNFKKGDRIRIRVAGNDGGGTMASGFTFTLDYGHSVGGADGDSYVQFTETFDFLTSDPSTATLYPTATAAAVDPGGSGTDTFEAWTSRGAGSTNAIRATAAGWTAPLQMTVSSGGNLVEWFSRQLAAFTLAGPVLINVRAKESNIAANAAIRAELAVTASDGTGATVWAATSFEDELSTTDAAKVFYLAGADLAVTDGQRLRLRLYIDDTSEEAMAASQTVTVTYAGTSGGAAGDTFFTFGQALTEFVAGAGGIPFKRKDGLWIPHRDDDPWSTNGGWA